MMWYARVSGAASLDVKIRVAGWFTAGAAAAAGVSAGAAAAGVSAGAAVAVSIASCIEDGMIGSSRSVGS